MCFNSFPLSKLNLVNLRQPSAGTGEIQKKKKRVRVWHRCLRIQINMQVNSAPRRGNGAARKTKQETDERERWNRINRERK